MPAARSEQAVGDPHGGRHVTLVERVGEVPGRGSPFLPEKRAQFRRTHPPTLAVRSAENLEQRLQPRYVLAQMLLEKVPGSRVEVNRASPATAR